LNVQIENGLPDDKNHFPSTSYFLPKDKIELTNGVVFITAEPNTVYEPLKKGFSLRSTLFYWRESDPNSKETGNSNTSRFKENLLSGNAG
jgi:hypothetical protein